MANFQDSRFFGISPRAVGMSVLAIAIVVGLFFIPETVKFLFDSKPRAAKADKVVVSERSKPSTEVARAALSPDALSSIQSEVAKPQSAAVNAPAKGSRRDVDADDSKSGGFFSGWNFGVKAGTQGGEVVPIPSGLTFDRIASKEGQAFVKKGLPELNRFFRRERLSPSSIQDAAQPLILELQSVGSISGKGAQPDEIANRVRSIHIQTVRDMRRAGADRGVMLRWLELPLVRFIDDRGGVGAARRIKAGFAPKFALSDVKIRQPFNRGWSVDGRSPISLIAEFSVQGTDIDKIVAYANGKIVRTMKLGRLPSGENRTFRFNGDAYGVWTFAAYDRYGVRPFVKSYSFYPRARVFSQSPDGTYQIGFMPGSAPNSLDRFFYVGGSSRPGVRDPMVSRF